jgi:hypothetical protein
MARVVIGLFNGRRSADTVVEHLVQEFGVPRERIQLHATDLASGDETRSPQDANQDAALPELGLPGTAGQAYGDGMRRGDVLLLAWVDDEHADHALATYREYGATHPEAFETTGAPGTGDPEQATRVRAYHLWENEGRPEGRDLEFWLRARADGDDTVARAPQEFTGETGAAPLPEPDRSSGA